MDGECIRLALSRYRVAQHVGGVDGSAVAAPLRAKDGAMVQFLLGPSDKDVPGTGLARSAAKFGDGQLGRDLHATYLGSYLPAFSTRHKSRPRTAQKVSFFRC